MSRELLSSELLRATQYKFNLETRTINFTVKEICEIINRIVELEMGVLAGLEDDESKQELMGKCFK